jgi:hypothetical protein
LGIARVAEGSLRGFELVEADLTASEPLAQDLERL